MSNKIKTKKILISVLFLVLLGVGIKAGASWVLPSGGTPPTMNIFPPINVGDILQFKNGNFVALGLKSTISAIFEGSLQITAGNGIPEQGKVLTSDALGFASWQTPSGGGGGGGGGMTNVMTDLGDMIYGQVGGVPTRLPVGDAGQVLTVTNGIPDWQTLGNPSAGGWTDDGTVVRLTTSTDKVGIGLTNPTEQLQITQNMRLPNTNSSGTAGVILFGNERFLHNPGNQNTFVGKNSGKFNVTGGGNTGVGESALSNISSGGDNSALGFNALLNNTTGSANVASGKDALKTNTGGSNNTGNGYQSLLSNSGGNGNSALGSGSLSGNNSGDNNTGVGKDALNTNTSGSSNTALGANADVGSGGLTNATAIGANAIVNASNTMVFGNSSVIGWGFGAQPGGDAIKVGGPGTPGSGARLTQGGEWTDGSDRILKYDISDTKYGLDTILALRPVDYKLKINDEPSVGFIAQEVKEVIPEVVYGKDGEMTMSYSHLTAVLTKAVQELKEENDDLRARLEYLKSKVKGN